MVDKQKKTAEDGECRFDSLNDRQKIIFDFFKHLTTLSTAGVLLVTGLAGRDESVASLAAGASASFAVSLVASFVTMLAITFRFVPIAENRLGKLADEYQAIFLGFTLLLSIIAFFLGMYQTTRIIAPGSRPVSSVHVGSLS
jgi:hypothetical protein